MSEENSNQNQHAGVISDLGVLDLRYAKSPADLSTIKMIRDVGVVLITEDAAQALAQIQIRDVGSVVTLPSSAPVNCMTGQIKISGEALAAGDPETILVIVGQGFVTSSIPSVGYKEIRIVGQFFAPRESQAVLSAKLTQITGQILYVPANPRLILGEESINREYLELLPHPAAFVVMGNLIFETDVPKDLLKEKIPEIVLLGNISAPHELITLLKVITPERLGNIVGR